MYNIINVVGLVAILSGQVDPNELLDRTVRIKATYAGFINIGTGTVVRCEPDNTTIVTCKHILEGKDPSWTIEGLFKNGSPQFISKKVLGTEPSRYEDFLIIELSDRLPCKPATIGGFDDLFGNLVTVGCNNGGPPSLGNATLISYDKVWTNDGGRQNYQLKLKGWSTDGRSGGPIYNGKNGRLIGTIWGYDGAISGVNLTTKKFIELRKISGKTILGIKLGPPMFD